MDLLTRNVTNSPSYLSKTTEHRRIVLFTMSFPLAASYILSFRRRLSLLRLLFEDLDSLVTTFSSHSHPRPPLQLLNLLTRFRLAHLVRHALARLLRHHGHITHLLPRRFIVARGPRVGILDRLPG